MTQKLIAYHQLAQEWSFIEGTQPFKNYPKVKRIFVAPCRDQVPQRDFWAYVESVIFKDENPLALFENFNGKDPCLMVAFENETKEGFSLNQCAELHDLELQ